MELGIKYVPFYWKLKDMPSLPVSQNDLNAAEVSYDFADFMTK